MGGKRAAGRQVASVDQQDPNFPGLEDTQPVTSGRAPFPGVTWGLRDIAVGIMAALVVFFIVAGMIVGAAAAIYGEDAVETLFAEAMAVAVLDLVLVGTVLIVVGRKGAGLPELGFRAPNRGARALLGMIILAYFSSIAVVNLYGILLDVAGLDDLLPGPQLPDDLFDHDSVVIVTGIAVVFMAPIAEEVFFRGFIYAGLRRYLNMPIAGLISGLLFSIAHGDPGLVVPFALVGAILAYTYERSRSLVAPIGVHFVFNTLSFLLLLLVPEWR